MYEHAVVVDFDGTICEHRFPDTGPPTLGVRQALEQIHNLGYKIIVHSCRTADYWHEFSDQEVVGAEPGEELDVQRQAEQFKIIHDYMEEHNLPYDEIYESNKPLGRFYIDDRGLTFDDNWQEIIEHIKERT